MILVISDLFPLYCFCNLFLHIRRKFMLWTTRIIAVVSKLHVSLERSQPQPHPVLQGNLPDFEFQRKTQDNRLKEVILIYLIILMTLDFSDMSLFFWIDTILPHRAFYF